MQMCFVCLDALYAKLCVIVLSADTPELATFRITIIRFSHSRQLPASSVLTSAFHLHVPLCCTGRSSLHMVNHSLQLAVSSFLKRG